MFFTGGKKAAKVRSVWSSQMFVQPSSCLSNTGMANETTTIQRHLLEDVVGVNSNLFQFLDPF